MYFEEVPDVDTFPSVVLMANLPLLESGTK